MDLNAPDAISVIIPNYNHGTIVKEAISAFAFQNAAPAEIIVVDDKSTDNSLVELEALAVEFPSLRIIARQTRRGPVAALNVGLQAARGQYVCFGAADDVMLSGTLTALLAAVRAHPQAAFASCEALVVEAETGKITTRPPVRPAQTTGYLSPASTGRVLRRIDNWILCGAALVRRDLVIAEGGFDETLGPFADGYLLRSLALRHGCCFVPHLGLVWRVSQRSYSRSVAADPAAAQRMLEMAMTRMRGNDVFPPWYPALFARRWRFGTGLLAARARPINEAMLTTLSARGPLGRVLLRTAARFGGKAAELAALMWLFLQERPTSLVGLVWTYARRRMSGAHASHRGHWGYLSSMEARTGGPGQNQR